VDLWFDVDEGQLSPKFVCHGCNAVSRCAVGETPGHGWTCEGANCWCAACSDERVKAAAVLQRLVSQWRWLCAFAAVEAHIQSRHWSAKRLEQLMSLQGLLRSKLRAEQHQFDGCVVCCTDG
jgi:hypothetical protein